MRVGGSGDEKRGMAVKISPKIPLSHSVRDVSDV